MEGNGHEARHQPLDLTRTENQIKLSSQEKLSPQQIYKCIRFAPIQTQTWGFSRKIRRTNKKTKTCKAQRSEAYSCTAHYC